MVHSPTNRDRPTCLPCIQTSACGALSDADPAGKIPLSDEACLEVCASNETLILWERKSRFGENGKLPAVGVSVIVGKMLQFMALDYVMVTSMCWWDKTLKGGDTSNWSLGGDFILIVGHWVYVPESRMNEDVAFQGEKGEVCKSFWNGGHVRAGTWSDQRLHGRQRRTLKIKSRCAIMF